MFAMEGRDYEHRWNDACLDGGEHDVLELMTVRSYLPSRGYCKRCHQRSTVVPLLDQGVHDGA